YNYTAGKDTIHISSGSISKATVSGKDVILKIGSGSMRLKNAKGKNISIIDANGLAYTQPYTASKSTGISYSTGAANVKVAKAFTGSMVDASNASEVKTINASAVTKNLTIKGNKLANTIKAGSGGSNLYGQKGNDSLYGGKGKDVFWYANGDGKDTIYNYTAGKDKIRLTSGSISKATVSGKDVIFKIGSGSICVKNAKGAKITVTDANGKTTSKVYGNANTSRMLASDSYALEEESTNYVSASTQLLDNVAGTPEAFDSSLVASKDSSGSNSTNALSLAASTEIAPESGNSTDLNALSYRS
ncbi:MAG: hypothetical protein IKH16_03955, partial [Selenomonadaceae bacterium]|nr:hypothetical protein [Selenomonadaceae bacterium]